MSKTEHDYLRPLLKALRKRMEPRAVIRKHADYLTSGGPDFSVTRSRKTSWWEAKHANPIIKGTGLQLLTAQRLEREGTCWYIVYWTKGEEEWTCLVRPQDVHKDGTFTPSMITAGVRHDYVVDFIELEHLPR